MLEKINKSKKEFVYSGENLKRQKIEGEIVADNIRMAKAMLRKQGLRNPIIKPKRKSFLKRSFENISISPLDIALFSRQMATMQAAGIPLVQSLTVIIKSIEKKGLSNLARKIKENVERGSPLSEALKAYPEYFDELYCNLVEAGEQSGTLENMLNRIALYKERTESLKRKLKKAMYYPIIVLIIAAIVTTILLIKVVPTFKEMFAGFNAELPVFTLFVLHISEILQQYGPQVLLFIIASMWLLTWLYRNKKPVRYFFEKLILRLPVAGKILHKSAIARFARTLSTTFAAGMPLTEALTSVAKASGNIIYFNAILQIRDAVAGGQQMQIAMQSSKIFPNIVVQMVAIGEESGTLEEMMRKIADIYEEEVNTAIDGMSTLLEPIIMIILGIIVGGLVIAMYLPIFKLGSAI